MSGPKGASYRVVSEAELRRRAVAAANARLTAIRVEIESLRRALGSEAAAAGTAPRLGAQDSLDAVEGRLQDARAYSDRLRALRQASRERAVRAALIDALPALQLTIDLAPRLADPVPLSGHATDSARAQERLRHRLTRLAEILVDVPEAERAALAAKIRTAQSTLASAGADATIASLEVAVSQSVRRAHVARRFDRDRRELATEYAEILSRRTDLFARIGAALESRELDDLRPALDEARREAAQAADRAYALAQAEAALKDLGYRVEVSHDDTRHVDRLAASRTKWPNHELHLVFPEGRTDFSTVPVATAETHPADDVGFERSSCEDFDALISALARAGVDVDVSRRAAIGVTPLLRKKPQTTSHARRTEGMRER